MPPKAEVDGIPLKQSRASKSSKKKKKKSFPDLPWNPEDQDRAMEELKLLQGIISGQEGYRLQVRNWGISLISLITVSFLSEDVLRIHPLSYLLVALALVGLFYVLEIYHAVAEYRAMDRSRTVEETLRKRKFAYYGPLIGITLIQRVKDGELKKLARLRRIYMPYGVMALVIVMTASLKAISQIKPGLFD